MTTPHKAVATAVELAAENTTQALVLGLSSDDDSINWDVIATVAIEALREGARDRLNELFLLSAIVAPMDKILDAILGPKALSPNSASKDEMLSVADLEMDD